VAGVDDCDATVRQALVEELVDHAEEAAGRLSLYRVEAATDQAMEIADVLVLATREVGAA
jgi:hypothetical protein